MHYTAWVRRLIANLLTCWMLLLVPGATALDLVRPQMLLPACCRTHGAHHCMGGVQQGRAPAWRGASCPFADLQHAAVLLAPHLPAAPRGLVCAVEVATMPGSIMAALSAFLAGLPASRAPPALA